MSSGLDPQGASQPTQNQSYTTKGNPAETDPQEKSDASANAASNKNAASQETRIPTSQASSSDDATPSSLGRGIHGAPAGEEAKGKSNEDMGRHKELDGEQMAAAGDGETRDAVERKSGATGGEEDLAGDLDKKKAEQAPLRAEAKGDGKDDLPKEVDVQKVLREHAAS